MRGAREPTFYVGELGPTGHISNRDWPGIGPRVSIMDCEGKLLARLGDRTPAAKSVFTSPHGVAVDSQGAIYVAEVARTTLANRGVHLDPDEDPICLQKLTPKSTGEIQIS